MAAPASICLPTNWMDEPISIHLVGVGGTGCQVADQLASLHATLRALGHPGFRVRIYDPDTVSEANLGRQRFCRADIGHPKANVLTHRINIFHGLGWVSVPEAFRGTIVRSGDLVIGCVDTVAARKVISETRCWWLDCGNNAKAGHVILGRTERDFDCGEDEFRLPTWMDLFPGTPEDKDAPSCSVLQAVQRQSWPVNTRAAGIACELLYQWIREGSIDWHGALFTVTPPSITPLPIRPGAWLAFGYDD